MTHLVANLGWVDLDLGSSPRLVAATVATYCPSRMVEHPKSKSTQPRFATRCVTLYLNLIPSWLFSIYSESECVRQEIRTAMAASGGVTTYESSTTTTSKSWISSSSASSVSKAKRPNEGRKFVQKPSSLSVPSTFRQKVDRVFGKFKCLVPIVPFKQEGKFSRRPAARNIFLAK